MKKLAFLIVFLAPVTARADDGGAILVDAAHLMPQQGTTAGGDGVGAELRFLDDHENMTGGFGAFAIVGAHGTDQRRDLLDVRMSMAVKPKSDHIAPYLGVGIDVLHVTTYRTGMLDVRGSTLGFDGEAGILGTLGDKLVWRASAQYLGAIVPGTGEDLGGLILQVGLGWKMQD
jgi:hypothetical protein